MANKKPKAKINTKEIKPKTQYYKIEFNFKYRKQVFGISVPAGL